MQIIDGKAVAKILREKMAQQVKELNEKGVQPGLAVILVGDDPASQVYVRNKLKACDEVGITSFYERLSADCSFDDVANVIRRLNADPRVTAMILQLPLPKHLDENALIDLISPDKDADGCTVAQKGRLFTGRDALLPCTPYGIMELLNHYNIPLKGKKAVVVGRSNLVGKPLAQLLLKADCTVTVCHSKTECIGDITSDADIVCVAIGRAGFLKGDMVKDGAVVIDVGINRDSNGKLCGDVDFADVSPKCSYITPVPGGVGPMTVTMLLKNTLTACERDIK